MARTTVDLDPSVLRELKRRAREPAALCAVEPGTCEAARLPTTRRPRGQPYHEADTAELTPKEVESMDRHEGRHVAIIAARKEGMRKARDMRKMVAYGGTGKVR